MTIDELMDGALLQEMVDRKYVRVQAHPALPHLRIFNYTELHARSTGYGTRSPGSAAG